MKIWSWGANNTAQLGHRFSSEQISEPTEINLDNLKLNLCSIGHGPIRNENDTEILIQGGGSHTVIYSVTSGTLVHLGLICTKYECQLVTQLEPPPAEASLPNLHLKPQIATGWDFSLFLSPTGALYSCGDNSYGQLGLGVGSAKFYNSWTKLPIDEQILWSQISAGMRHAAAISTTGQLYVWGDNSKGQIGKKLLPKVVFQPINVTSQIQFIPKLIRCTKMGTILLSQDNKFYGTGERKFGLFQHNDNDSVGNFCKLFSDDVLESFLNGAEVEDFQCGWNHVLLLLSNGTIGSFGRNNFGQLGRKLVSETIEYDPCIGIVEDIPERITQIACGSEHNLALGISGVCYSYGWNEHDNCGVGIGREIVWTPTVVPIPNNEYIVSISTGAGNSFVVTR